MEVRLPPIPPTAEARQPALDAALAAIKAADPAFDERVFLTRVQAEFYRVRQARQERNPERLRAYVSPALLQSWISVASQQRADGVTITSTGLVVHDMRLMWADHGPSGDVITAGIDGSCAVQAVRDSSGEQLFGDDLPQPVTEYWTWSRVPGALTQPVTPPVCPNCGAPAGADPGAACPYCGAGLPGPLQGWMLDRVDEQLEWAERQY